jgi:hypothetical protein
VSRRFFTSLFAQDTRSYRAQSPTLTASTAGPPRRVRSLSNVAPRTERLTWRGRAAVCVVHVSGRRRLVSVRPSPPPPTLNRDAVTAVRELPPPKVVGPAPSPHRRTALSIGGSRHTIDAGLAQPGDDASRARGATAAGGARAPRLAPRGNHPPPALREKRRREQCAFLVVAALAHCCHPALCRGVEIACRTAPPSPELDSRGVGRRIRLMIVARRSSCGRGGGRRGHWWTPPVHCWRQLRQPDGRVEGAPATRCGTV